MPATMTSLITDLRSHLDEATARQWSDTELERWLNEGLRDVGRRAEVLQTTTNVTAVAGTREYALTTSTLVNMTRIYRVEFTPTGQTNIYPLEYRDFSGMDSVWYTQQAVNQGYPYWYTLWGFPPSVNMVVYPTPSVGGTFKVFYYRTPAAVSGSTTVEIPEGWHDIVILYAESVALRKDGDPRWQEAKGLYEERIQAMIDMTRRWSDQAGMISTAASFVPSWLYEGDLLMPTYTAQTGSQPTRTFNNVPNTTYYGWGGTPNPGGGIMAYGATGNSAPWDAGGYQAGLAGAYGGMFDALMAQSQAAARLAGTSSGGSNQSIDPNLLNQEFGIRQKINNAGYQTNQYALNDATRGFQGQTAGWQNRIGQLGLQRKDIGLQRGQNSSMIQGLKFKGKSIKSQQAGAKTTARQQTRDINSQSTAAGAYGSAGRQEQTGTVADLLKQQLFQLEQARQGVGQDIRQGMLQDTRLQGQLKGVGLDETLANKMQGLNYGAFLDANGQFNLANALTGMQGNLLSNSQAQALAHNAKANVSGQSNALAALGLQNQSMQGMMGMVQSLLGNPNTAQLGSDLWRQISGQGG